MINPNRATDSFNRQDKCGTRRNLYLVPPLDDTPLITPEKIVLSSPKLELEDFASIEMRQISYVNKKGTEVKYLRFYGSEAKAFTDDGVPSNYKLHQLKAKDVKEFYSADNEDWVNKPAINFDPSRISLEIPQEIKLASYLIPKYLVNGDNADETSSGLVWEVTSTNSSGSSDGDLDEIEDPELPVTDYEEGEVGIYSPVDNTNTVKDPGFVHRSRSGGGGSGGGNGGGGGDEPPGSNGEPFDAKGAVRRSRLKRLKKFGRNALLAVLATAPLVSNWKCSDNPSGRIGAVETASTLADKPDTTLTTEIVTTTTTTEAPTTTTTLEVTTTTSEVPVIVIKPTTTTTTSTTEAPTTTTSTSPPTSTTEAPEVIAPETTSTTQPEIKYMEPNVVGERPCGPAVDKREVAERLAMGEVVVKPGETAEFLNQNPQVEDGLNVFYYWNSGGDTEWIKYIQKNVAVTNPEIFDGGKDSGVRTLKARTIGFTLDQDTEVQNHQCDPITGEITPHDGPQNRYNRLKAQEQVWAVLLTVDQMADMQSKGIKIPDNMILIDVDENTRALILERLACNNPLLEMATQA